MSSQRPARGTVSKRLLVAVVVLLGLAFPITLIAVFGNPDRDQGRLIKELRDPNASVRARAAFELGEDQHPTESAIWALTRLLTDGDDEPRSEAVAALISIGHRDSSKAKAVTRAMISVISPPSVASSSRVQAARVLSQLGAKNHVARDALLAALHARDDSLRATAAAGLGQIGLDDAATVQALERAVDDAIAGVRAAALESLARLRPGDGTPKVAARLVRDTSVEVRLAAIYALAGAAQYEPPVDLAIDVALQDSIPEIRRAAVIALAHLAANAVVARDKLELLSADSAASVRQAALEVLRVPRTSRP